MKLTPDALRLPGLIGLGRGIEAMRAAKCNYFLGKLSTLRDQHIYGRYARLLPRIIEGQAAHHCGAAFQFRGAGVQRMQITLFAGQCESATVSLNAAQGYEHLVEVIRDLVGMFYPLIAFVGHGHISIGQGAHQQQNHDRGREGDFYVSICSVLGFHCSLPKPPANAAGLPGRRRATWHPACLGIF